MFVKKRIFISNIGTDIGGIESSFITFINTLDLNKFEIDILLWREKGVLYKNIPKSINVQFIKKPESIYHLFNKYSIRKNIIDYLWFIRYNFFKLLLRPGHIFEKNAKQYDVAMSYCQNGYSPYYVIDCINAKKKYLWYHHGDYTQKGLQKKIDSKYWAIYDKVISVSKANKSVIIDSFPKLKDKVEVIGNLRDTKNIINKSQEYIAENIDYNREYVFVSVGRIVIEKGYDIAVEAAKLLKDKGIDFIWLFIGDGYYYDTINNLIQSYELCDYCKLIGKKENPYPYMRKADLVILTSRVEAQSLIIMEALILDKLIVASSLPSISEQLNNGELGVLCQLSPTTIVDAITKILGDKELQNKILGNVKQNIVDSEVVIKKIIGLINS